RSEVAAARRHSSIACRWLRSTTCQCLVAGPSLESRASGGERVSGGQRRENANLRLRREQTVRPRNCCWSATGGGRTLRQRGIVQMSPPTILISGTFRMRSGWLLALMASLLFLCNLGGAHLWDEDEAIFSQTAREMHEQGEMIVPQFNGQLFAHKPP